MNHPINVLFITPEVVPFCKTGGLADVSGALPVELAKQGLDVRITCPYYREAREYFENSGGNPDSVLEECTLWLGGRLQKYRILESVLPGSNVVVYFIDFPALYDRPELYTEKGEDYWDNFFRFAFFSRASLDLPGKIGFKPSVVHANDWQSSLAAVYLRTVFSDDPVLGDAKSVLTIHNLAFQGIFDKGFLDSGDLPLSLFTSGALEFWGQINVLKGGIVFSDAVNTVSPTYANEIKTKEFGYGLDGLLWYMSGKLTGILNGIDYSVWNPEIDEHIPFHFSSEDLSGKMKCKIALQREMGLPERDDVFLIGIVSRLADQKGFDLIAEAFDKLMNLDIQIVLLGTGMPEYHKFFEKMAVKYADRFAVRLEFDNALSHLIEAGSDAFLMSSLYEPCGLNQLYSLRYGTIPIVRTTGGLKDTVVSATKADISGGRATGFKFAPYTSRAMLRAVKSALKLYRDAPESWRKLIRNAMLKDFSWRESAHKYIELYRKLLQV